MPSLFTELRRRNVFKVGAAYAIVAWLLLQITDVVLPTFNTPQWVAQTITFVLAIGFPLALVLAWALDITPQGVKAESPAETPTVRAPPTALRFGYISQVLILLAVGFLVIDQYILEPGASVTPTNDTADAHINRSSIILGATQQIGNTLLRAHIAFSPDGRRIVYAAQANGVVQLYLRELDQLEARPILDTEGAYYPFFSPDGDWVGFFVDGEAQLKKVPLQGGPSQILASTGYTAGGSWITDDTILFGTGNGGIGRLLFRVSSTGGDAEIVMQPEPETGHGWPEVLPGARAVLLGIKPGDGGVGPARDGSIGVVSLDSGELRHLVQGGHTPRYAPTGHVLFVRAGALWAVPFDVERLVTTGDEVLVVDGVQQDGIRGGAAYAVSNDGTLVYAPGGDMTTEESTALVWVDREGNEEPLGAEHRQYLHLTLSPDGQRLAYTRTDGNGNQDIWMYDLVRGTFNRLTFDAAADNSPRWSPDGERIVFRSAREGMGLYWRWADGSGQAEQLFSAENNVYPISFTPDGEQFLFQDFAETWGVYGLSMNGEPNVKWLMDAQLVDWIAISPNGRWISYASQETGVREIYLSPFPDIDAGKWQVSQNGGAEPAWAPDSSELYYRGGPDMMAVTIEDTGVGPPVGVPRPLFMGDFVAVQRPTFAVSADGQRFLMLKAAEQVGQLGPGLTHLVIVENWFEELRRLAPESADE